MKKTTHRFDVAPTDIVSTRYWFRTTSKDSNGFIGLERSKDGKTWTSIDLDELSCAKVYVKGLLATSKPTGYDDFSLIRNAFE